MNIQMHGKKIRKVFLPDQTELNGDMWLSATYHGDRDEFWIVSETDGVEIQRTNARHVETIIWADQP